MKIKFYAIAVLMISFTANSFAQSTITASTTAVLVTPISIGKVADMNFGTVAGSSTSGTIVLDYLNGLTNTDGASITGGGTLPTTAEFTVTGESTSGFSIEIPTDPIVLTGSVAGTMTVSGFTADLGATSALEDGTSTIKIKATLNIPANAVAGTYSNASDLFVTVNYN